VSRRWGEKSSSAQAQRRPVGQVVARIDPETLRDMLRASITAAPKQGAGGQSLGAALCGSGRPRIFFPVGKRCCAQCCRRQIQARPAEVTEYYIAASVAHLIACRAHRARYRVIRPGEGEIVAARRLLERLLARYARFFDAVQGDALTSRPPLFGCAANTASTSWPCSRTTTPRCWPTPRPCWRASPTWCARKASA